MNEWKNEWNVDGHYKKKWRYFKLQINKYLKFQIFYSVNMLIENLTKYATLNFCSFSINSRWNQVMNYIVYVTDVTKLWK
jgi:hypothetical protein